MKTEPSLGKKTIFFVVTAVIASLAITIVSASSQKEDFFFSEKKEDNIDYLFLETSNNFINESVEIGFVDENSIVSAVPPLVYTDSVSYGTLFFDFEERKDVIEYMGEEGETIDSIAEKFNISVNTILWANKITNKSTNVVGRKIIILPVSGVIHEVKRGDTTGEIAKKYKAKVEEIVSFNELENEGSIYIGDILIIPNGIIPVVKPTVPVQTPSIAGFIVPAKGTISQGLHYYNAVDIANNCGAPIYASASGTIQRTGYHNIGGYYVRIIHSNGVVTYYGHLSKISVSVNQRISQGQIIGYMGNTGYTIGRTGCHLHFEVRGAKNPLAGYRVGHKF